MSGELNRLNSTFNSFFNVIRIPNTGNATHDEETPIINESTNNNNNIPEMPGAFTFPNEVNNDINNNQNTTPMSNYVSKFFDRLITIFIVSLFLIVFIPVYVFYRIVLYVFFILLSILVKFNRHGYKKINNKHPANTARKFIMKFDERIGNKSNVYSNDNGDMIRDDINANSGLSTLGSENEIQEIGRPDFLECAYSHALFIVKKEIKWLLVYIESDQNNDAINFTNDVLTNEEFLTFIKDRNILVWGNDISESEAYQICNQFKITKLPFLGLFCLTVNQTPTTSGMRASLPSLSLVMKIQGYKTLDYTLKKFNRAFNKYNPALVQLRQHYTNSEGELSSSDSIQRAYRQFRQNLNSPPVIRSLERNNNERAKLQWLKWRKSRLIPENNIDGEFARIAIRCVDGTRKQYKLDKHSSIEELYALVECTILNNIEVDENEQYQEPENYSHNYTFDLINVLPRVVIPISYQESIEENEYLYPSGNLVISIRE